MEADVPVNQDFVEGFGSQRYQLPLLTGFLVSLKATVIRTVNSHN